MKRRAALVSTCAIGLGLSSALARHAEQQSMDIALDGWALAAFMLTDHHGRPFTREHLRGCWTFVLFGDTTTCATPCGAALAALTGLCQRIERADAMKTTQILFISLDPTRDTPARLRVYLAAHDSRFIGATAAPAALQRVADDMGTGAAAVSLASADARRRDRGSLVLIGPDATIRAEYPPPFDVLRLTASYMRTRRGSR